MIVDKPEDSDLVGMSGAALYQRMSPLRKACFLNIVKKASDATTAAGCLPAFRDLLIVRQDRLFARVADGLRDALRAAPMFKSAPGALHEPPPGFSPPLESFKSKDPHANLQVTFMTELATGGLRRRHRHRRSVGHRAWLRSDPEAGVQQATNPFLIHEFMSADDLLGARCLPLPLHLLTRAWHRRLAGLTIPTTSRRAAAGRAAPRGATRLRDRSRIAASSAPRLRPAGTHRASRPVPSPRPPIRS